MTDVIVIGAGHNGLVTAAYLAKSGLDVLVLERRHIVGGAAASEELFPGVRISTCAHNLDHLQGQVVQDLDLYSHGFRVVKPNPGTLSLFPDGRSLLHWSDVDRMQESIRIFSQRDADRYPEWLAFWKRAGALFARYDLTTPPTIAELREEIEGTDDEDVLKWILDRTPADLLDEFFESEPIRAALTVTADTLDLDGVGELSSWAVFFSTHASMPEYQGLPIGGMGGLSEALARSAESFGARIRLGAEVSRIVLDDTGRAVGVELVDGQLIRARTVVSNADPRRTFLGLVGPDALNEPMMTELDRLRLASGSHKFHAIVDELPDLSRFLGPDADPRWLSTVRICPSLAYYRDSLECARKGVPSLNPILHVQIPTVHDDTLAPPGTHVVSMWIRFEPTTLQTGTWDDVRQQEGERAIDIFTEYAPNFRRSIKDWLIYTPDDLESRVYLTAGNIFHSDHAAGQLFGDRLFDDGGHRTPIPGLFMCGAGTHPGGHVSGAPGYNAARVILEDLEAGHEAPVDPTEALVPAR